MNTKQRIGLYTLGLILTLLIIAIDTWMSYEINFVLFYLAPILLVSWCLGRTPGLFFSFLCACGWLSSDIINGYVHSHWGIYLWNTGIRLGIFCIVALLTASLKKTLDKEHENATTDFLTGAVNLRLLRILMRVELDRLSRYAHAFSLMYLDVDNFKTINDTLGHAAGDDVLKLLITRFRAVLRKSDIISRIGGDEFIVLLPETQLEEARHLFEKIQQDIATHALEHHWPISLSAGIITCTTPNYTVDALITAADNLLYQAKHQGKNQAVSQPMPQG